MSDPKVGEWRAYTRKMGGVGIGEIVSDDGELLVSTPGLYPSRFIPVSKLRSLGPPLDPAELMKAKPYVIADEVKPIAADDVDLIHDLVKRQPAGSVELMKAKGRTCLGCRHLDGIHDQSQDRPEGILAACDKYKWSNFNTLRSNMRRAATCDHFEECD